MSRHIREDEHFAIVPEWVLDAELKGRPISDRAIRVYARLGRFANRDGEAYPSRATLARLCGGCSRDSIDRAVKELVAVGAIQVRHLSDDEKGLQPNLYLLRRTPPSRNGAASWPQGCDTPSRTGAAQNENQLNEIPPGAPPRGGSPRKRTRRERLSREQILALAAEEPGR